VSKMIGGSNPDLDINTPTAIFGPDADIEKAHYVALVAAMHRLIAVDRMVAMSQDFRETAINVAAGDTGVAPDTPGGTTTPIVAYRWLIHSPPTTEQPALDVFVRAKYIGTAAGSITVAIYTTASVLVGLVTLVPGAVAATLSDTLTGISPDTDYWLQIATDDGDAASDIILYSAHADWVPDSSLA